MNLSPADFAFIVANVFLARAVTPPVALCMSVVWFGIGWLR
jgi:hypothetical protein